MKTQQFIKTAALILLLCVTAVESAHAGLRFSTSGRSGSSSTFKSGFSSQKYSSVPSRSPANAAGKSTSFGSFGASGDAAPAASPATKSALSKDLNATSANATALKTFDARNQNAAPVAASNFATGSAAPSGYVSPSMYAQSAMPHTVIVQRDSGFSTSPFLWFMLGHSMASQGRDRVINDRQVYADGGAVGAPTGGADPAPFVATLQPQESLGARLLRVVLWLAIIGAAIAGVIYLLFKRAARIATAKPHYSLGKI